MGCTDKNHVQGPPALRQMLDVQKRRQRELRHHEELPEFVQPVGYKFIFLICPLPPVGKVALIQLEEEITYDY